MKKQKTNVSPGSSMPSLAIDDSMMSSLRHCIILRHVRQNIWALGKRVSRELSFYRRHHEDVTRISRALATLLLSANLGFAQDFTKMIDSISALKNDSNRVVYAKVENGRYIHVVGDNWPKVVVESINIYVMDGRIRCIAVLPSSESGDWFYSTDNYYDSEGKLIGYTETKNYFNSECAHGVIFKVKLFVKYGTSYKLTKQTIQDEAGTDMTQAGCLDPYNFKPDLILDANKFKSKLPRR